MRYYFINQEMEELRVEVQYSEKTQSFLFKADDQVEEIYFRTLAGKKYISFDKKSWKKIPSIGMNETLVSHSEVFKVYRGFKPSGLNKGAAGDLVTQMPGKVVKVLKKEGESVQKGDTVLILEAMKMENEIKSGTAGIIKSIHVSAGQALESGFLMVEIEES